MTSSSAIKTSFSVVISYSYSFALCVVCWYLWYVLYVRVSCWHLLEVCLFVFGVILEISQSGGNDTGEAVYLHEHTGEAGEAEGALRAAGLDGEGKAEVRRLEESVLILVPKSHKKIC